MLVNIILNLLYRYLSYGDTSYLDTNELERR